MTYASEAWGSQIYPSSWTKLEKIQTTCIAASSKIVSNRTLFQSVRLSTVQKYITIETKNIFYKNSISYQNHIYNIGRENTELYYT